MAMQQEVALGVAVDAVKAAKSLEETPAALGEVVEVAASKEGIAPVVAGAAQVVMSRDGRVLRYNFEYEIGSCCGPSAGLAKDVLDHVPEALAKKGLSQDVWAKHTGQLRAVNGVVESAGDLPSALCAALLSPVLLATGCCCGYLCKRQVQKLRKWDEALRAWQANFNEELEPLGIFLKSQSTCCVTRGEYGEKQRHVFRWLAFALTPRQVGKLKDEPHLRGDVEDGSRCFSIDEGELCMHPGC